MVKGACPVENFNLNASKDLRSILTFFNFCFFLRLLESNLGPVLEPFWVFLVGALATLLVSCL